VDEIKCKHCGVAEQDRTLLKRRRSFRSTHYHTCASCEVKLAERGHWRTLVSYVIVGAAAAIWAAKDPEPGLRWFVLNLTALYFANIPATALHELGHVMAGWLVRWRTYHVVVGWFGKPLLFKKWRGVKWQFNSVPVGGMAYVFPRDGRWFSPKAFIVYFGGPLVNLLTAAACFAVVDWPFATYDRELHLLGSLGFASLAAAVVSLLPYRVNFGGTLLDTDGRAMLRAIFRPATLKREMLKSAALLEVNRLREAGVAVQAMELIERTLTEYPDDLLLQLTRAVLQGDLGLHREARSQYLEMLQRSEAQPDHLALLWNNIAWSDFMLEDPELLNEALDFSEQAVKAFDSSSAYLGTRGSVLIWAGQVDDGIQLVKRAYETKDADVQGAALNASVLGLGEALRGNMAESAHWLRIAEALDPNCPLLDRARHAQSKSHGAEHLS